MRRLNTMKGRFDRNFPPEDRGIELALSSRGEKNVSRSIKGNVTGV